MCRNPGRWTIQPYANIPRVQRVLPRIHNTTTLHAPGLLVAITRHTQLYALLKTDSFTGSVLINTVM